MASLSAAFGRLYHALALVACVLLFAMVVVICGDVFLRNVPLIRTMRGFPATNDLSEAFLYLITLLSSPWLLRKGQHIRVDVLLRVIPRRWAWYCEWAVDALGLLCCLVGLSSAPYETPYDRLAGHMLDRESMHHSHHRSTHVLSASGC